jgi:NADH dehydrogenase (ubiquinone) 1 alpha/beta subcomplex 1
LDPKVVEERVITVVSNFEKVEASKVTKTAKFKEDLDLDSLDAVEVVMAVEEEFGIEIPDSEADKIWSVADAVAYVSGHPMAK